MPSFSAKPRPVVLLAFEGALALDIAGPSDAFGITNRLDGTRPPYYSLRYVSLRGGAVRTSSGLTIETERVGAHLFRDLDTLIVSGGSFMERTVLDQALVRWVARAASHARRVCSVCSGAFLLAEAGLLDERRAVTHWDMTEAFRSRYPRVRLQLDPIFIEDGNIWTSAGVTAGIDLALALIRRDLGPAIAMATAKDMVMFMQRPGGQAQFSAALLGQAAMHRRDDPMIEIASYISANLAGDLSVPALAHRVSMSPRSFARLFDSRSDNLTPAKLVEGMRVEAAARALSETASPIKQIAAMYGFRDEERMRRAFLRKLGVAPSEYRARLASA